MREKKEQENKAEKKEFIEMRFKDMQEIGKKMAEVKTADMEISQLNWIMSNQDQYLENLGNIMKHTSKLTGNVTGNYGDLK